MTEKTISEVHVSPGSAETCVRRGGVTNYRYRLIACSLSNICAKNYQIESFDTFSCEEFHKEPINDKIERLKI